MKKYILYAFSILFFLSLLSCGNKKKDIKKPEDLPPVNILYKKGFELLEMGYPSRSIELFKKIETRYSYSDLAPKSTLMIVYINYELGEPEETLKFANKFKKLYPRSSYISYLDYIIGLTFYEQIGVSSRDQKYTKFALKQFEYLLKKYPNSLYSDDARLKIDLINEQLAGKEIYIARYYMKKSKWIPAIKRLNIIIDKYDTTIYSEEALHRLVEIYYKLGNIKLAKKYAAILGYNFNDGDWYKKTYKIVADKNYNIEKIKTKKKLKDRIKKMFFLK